MLQRFNGPDTRRFLIEALLSQPIVGGDTRLAEALAATAEVVQFPSGSGIVEESAPGNDLHFILVPFPLEYALYQIPVSPARRSRASWNPQLEVTFQYRQDYLEPVLAGTVSIRVFSREIAVRTAGQHFGEMALLDPGKPRSASVVADGKTVTARIPAAAFADLADNSPRLWKNVARTLADRLSQRNRFVQSMNPRPALFVGCSAEALPIGKAIQSTLEQDPIVLRVWTDDTFKASQYPIESLELELAKVDFAALVLSPDDFVISRNRISDAPRDNLIFELGLFMGALGRTRTFLLHPHGADIKIPTDLSGLTALTYQSGPHGDKLHRHSIRLQPDQSHHHGDGTTLTYSGESIRMALGDNLRSEVRKNSPRGMGH